MACQKEVASTSVPNLTKNGQVENDNHPSGSSKWFTDGSRMSQVTEMGVFDPAIKRSVALGIALSTFLLASCYACNI